MAKLMLLLAGVPVMITTLAFAGNMPLGGKGKRVPPPVMVGLTFVKNAGFAQRPLQGSAAVGQVAVMLAVLSGFAPTWKNAISSSYSLGEHASTNMLWI